MRERDELREFGRAALLPPEDLAERAEGQPLYALFDPEQGGPEVTALGTEDEGCIWLYTSVALLVRSCGDGQPYVRLTTSEVAGLARAVDGVLLVALDVWHPAGARYPYPDPQAFDPLEPVPTEPVAEPLVWIPTRPVRAGDQVVSAELHGRRPGERLLLVFDSPEDAWRACGEFQPLSAIHLDDLDAVVWECGADAVVAGNGVLSEEARHAGPVLDWPRGGNSRYRR